MPTYFVDPASGSNTNGGSSTGSAIVSGSSADTDGTTTIDLSTDNPDLSGVTANVDSIYLASETGGKNSVIFDITAVDNTLKTVTVQDPPDNTATVAWAIGGA